MSYNFRPPFGQPSAASGQMRPGGVQPSNISRTPVQIPNYAFQPNRQPPFIPPQYIPQQIQNVQFPAVYGPVLSRAPVARPQNMDLSRHLEDHHKTEKERNFAMQQQRLKQFSVGGKKGSMQADSLINSMFGNLPPKAPQTSPQSPQHRSSPPLLQPVLSSSPHQPMLSSPPPINPTSPQPQVIHNTRNMFPPVSKSPLPEKKDKKELDAMMLECSDLTGSHKAAKFSKPAVKEVSVSCQPRSQFTVSHKARDWRNLQGLDQVFLEKRPQFPAWCSPENIPEMFRKVEAYVTENGTHAPATNLLFPILVSSGLPQKLLGAVWEMVNQSTPGCLTVREMYAALALVAVMQAGHPVKSVDILHQFHSCPIPQLQCFTNLHQESTTPESPKSDTTECSIHQPTEAIETMPPKEQYAATKPVILPTPSQQLVKPVAISHAMHCTSINPSIQGMQIAPSIVQNEVKVQPCATSFFDSADEEFDDFKSATPNVAFPPSSSSPPGPVQSDDDFDDFKQAPSQIVNSASGNQNTAPNSFATMPAVSVEQDLMSPDDDKYSVFRYLQPESGNSKDTSPEDVSGGEPVVSVGLFTAMPDEFGDFLQASTPSSTNQVDDLAADFADFANFQEPVCEDDFGSFSSCQPVAISKLHSQISSKVHRGDGDFSEFASNVVVPAPFPSPDLNVFRNLKDTCSLSESQSVSSLELGTFDGAVDGGESRDLSRQGSLPSLDLRNAALEGGDESFGDFQNASSPFHPHSPSPEDLVTDSDHSPDSENYQTESLSDKYSAMRQEEEREQDIFVSSWLLLLSTSLHILQNTKKIFHTTTSKTIISECLSLDNGRNYILDVIEIYKVVCRVAAVSKALGKQTPQLLDLIEENKQSWNTVVKYLFHHPIIPDDSAFKFDGFILPPDVRDRSRACGVCLLDVDHGTKAVNESANKKLSYGGRSYHSTCANLWINCVEPTLPALTHPCCSRC